jgi:hypothetical protein
MGKGQRGRAVSAPEQVEVAAPEVPAEPEPMATMWGVWREPGAGYRWVRFELPREAVMRYAGEAEGGHVAQPEVPAIVMAQVADDMRRRSMRGQLG